jgi:uncharacterized membrane protein YkvA (DUF1232 family)
MGDARRPNWQVALALGIGLFFYLRSPIDLLPDGMGLFGLLDDLLLIGAGVWWLNRRLGDGRAAPDTVRSPDPYEILEVTRDASPEEITRAYREQMKRYHPDRVATLGTELQRVAHERTVAIQRAYDAIGRR